MKLPLSPPKLCFSLLLLAVLFIPLQAQQSTRYVYDDNGRLRAVIAPNGEAGVYEYDPAGNITAIRRLAADALEIIDFSARRGVPGNRVRIFGVGFDTGVSAVTFNGVAAKIISQSANLVVVEIPPNATTGPLSLTTTRGTTTTTIPFTIAGVLVIPPMVSVLPGQVIQFAAQVPGVTNQGVHWLVNDRPGGSSQIGTISTSGLYEAPILPASTIQVIVSAESLAQPGLRGESLVTITDNVFSTISGAVSVRYGNPPSTASAYAPFADALSVRYGTSANTNATPAITSVSVTGGPVINALSPASVAKGSSVTITITGVNLNGASALRFFNADGTVATGLSATNISGNGTTVTATISATIAATDGTKILVLTTTAGRTQTSNLGSNVITITQ